MKEKTKEKKLVEFELMVSFNCYEEKDTNRFMELLEDKIYDVLDKVAPENTEMSVLRTNVNLL